MASNGSTSFQLLTCRVNIRFQDPGLETAFDYLAARPRQPFPVRKTLSYEVRGTSPYGILEEGDLLDRVATRADVLHLVYRRVYRRVLERYVLAEWVGLHAALATIGGRRTLILGDKGAGKTTLATRLLYAGHRVEGDETVLVRNGQAVALPRAFHLKPGVDRPIPELTGHIPGLPKMFSGPIPISALDPTLLGFDWAIEVGPVDRVVWIAPNHGGRTSLESRPSFTAVQRILESSLVWQGTPQALVAVAARMGAAGGYELVFGDPWQAVRLLETME